MPDDLILMFAYHFPPENAIGAARPYRFYKYLRRLGYRVHVITAADVSGRPDLDAQTVDDPFFTRARQGVGWQIERAIRKVLLPGAIGTQWAVHASRLAARLIRKEQPTRITVFSTFPPLGAHLAGYWLRRRLGVPWVADYRDPMTANPIYDDWNDFRKAIYRKVERVFMGAADAVIANTDSARDRLVANYPERASNIHLIWNGFDPEQRLHPLPSDSNDRRVVSHVGELYGGRDISPILYSIKRLSQAGRLETARLKVKLVGPMEKSAIPDPEFMQSGEADGWLSVMPDRVPLSEAQTVVRKSDALLLVQPHAVLQVPGKLFEYLQTGRPILAYVPRNSPVERILQNSGVPYECIYTASGAEEMDVSIERFFNLNGVQSPPNRWFENEFNAENQSRKLADLIQELHAGALAESVAR